MKLPPLDVVFLAVVIALGVAEVAASAILLAMAPAVALRGPQ